MNTQINAQMVELVVAVDTYLANPTDAKRQAVREARKQLDMLNGNKVPATLDTYQRYSSQVQPWPTK